jgi:hypothetical protein
LVVAARPPCAFEKFLVDGAIAHPIDERLDDLEVDVSFEQRQADFPQRRFDVFGRQPPLPAQRFEDVLQACAEGLEHGVV